MMHEWRTHSVRPHVFDVCQDAECDKEHFISTLAGSRPVRDKYEGILHEATS